MILACDVSRLRSWSSRCCARKTRHSARSSAGHRMLPQASATHGARLEAAYAQLHRYEHPKNPMQTDDSCCGDVI